VASNHFFRFYTERYGRLGEHLVRGAEECTLTGANRQVQRIAGAQASLKVVKQCGGALEVGGLGWGEGQASGGETASVPASRKNSDTSRHVSA
jgi:hypothetical protein